MIHLFRAYWATIYEGPNIWDASQKEMIINEFVNALHEDERMLAAEYKDEKGTDWNKYVMEKEKAGFVKFDQWHFMNFDHVTVQLKSKYKYRWGHRYVGIMVNDRKLDVQLYVVGNIKINKQGQTDIYDLVTDTAAADKMISDILESYLSVGHGINFKAGIDQDTRRRSELIKAFEDKPGYKLRAFTVIWINQNFMTLIVHEDEQFLECGRE